MNINRDNNIYNKNEYLAKFNQEMTLKKESNKSEQEKFKMSYKRPIPISNYDYFLFDFLPKIHKEILVKDLFQDVKNKNNNKRYFYKYLIGKIISKLYWDDFIYFLISDKNDDIIAISIYHFRNEFYPLNIELLENNYLSIGKYILIINPLFTFEHYKQIMCFDSCEFILFENNVSITKFIDMNSSLRNVEDFMKLGDLMMEKNLHDKAIYYYDKGIKKIKKKISDNNNDKLLLAELIYKISFSYINYGYFSKALSYTDYFYETFKEENSLIKNLKLKIFNINIYII